MFCHILCLTFVAATMENADASTQTTVTTDPLVSALSNVFPNNVCNPNGCMLDTLLDYECKICLDKYENNNIEKELYVDYIVKARSLYEITSTLADYINNNIVVNDLQVIKPGVYKYDDHLQLFAILETKTAFVYKNLAYKLYIVINNIVEKKK